MNAFSVVFEEPAWPELYDRSEDVTFIPGNESFLCCAVLEKGMVGGKPSLAIRIDLPDGKVVIAETSARLFCTAANAIQAKYPDLFDDP